MCVCVLDCQLWNVVLVVHAHTGTFIAHTDAVVNAVRPRNDRGCHVQKIRCEYTLVSKRRESIQRGSRACTSVYGKYVVPRLRVCSLHHE